MGFLCIVLARKCQSALIFRGNAGQGVRKKGKETWVGLIWVRALKSLSWPVLGHFLEIYWGSFPHLGNQLSALFYVTMSCFVPRFLLLCMVIQVDGWAWFQLAIWSTSAPCFPTHELVRSPPGSSQQDSNGLPTGVQYFQYYLVQKGALTF